MSREQVANVLRSRLEEIETYEKLFDDFERTCTRETPNGMRFTVGIARAVMLAMKKYIEENGDKVHRDAATVTPAGNAATG